MATDFPVGNTECNSGSALSRLPPGPPRSYLGPCSL